MGALPKVEESANGARYKSQGQARSEAERVAPGKYTNKRFRPERPKYAPYYTLSGLDLNFDSFTRGDALRACPWLLYLAPLALCCDFWGKARAWQIMFFQSHGARARGRRT